MRSTASGCGGRDIIIELVESWTVEVDSPAERTLRELGEHGVIVGLDDFGTGQNALGYFGRFPVRSFKFDRSLIQGMVGNETVRTVVAGLVRMANELGIDPLAEGIETDEQMRICRRIGIVKGQGFLLGRDLAVEELEEVDVRPGSLPSWLATT